MGFSDILNALDSKDSRQANVKAFDASAQAFFNYVKSQERIGVYLGNDIENTIYIMRDIITRIQYCGKVFIIGDANLAGILPFYKKDDEFEYNGGTFKCAMERISEVPHDGLPLILRGDGDYFEQAEINCKYLVVIQAYNSSELSYIRVTAPDGKQRIVYPFDYTLRDRNFSDLGFYRENKLFSDMVKKWWQETCKEAASACDKLISLSTVADVLPVEECTDSAFLICVLAALKYLKAASPHKPVIVVSFSKVDTTILEDFLSFTPDKWSDRWQSQFTASGENLKKGLISPLLKLWNEIWAKDCIVFIEDISGCDKENLASGCLYVYALPDAPADYFEEVVRNSTLPPLFTDVENIRIAIKAGFPFLCGVKGAYNDMFFPAVAQTMTVLCACFGNTLSTYANGADADIYGEIDAIGSFLSGYYVKKEDSLVDYFAALNNFAGQHENDKITQSAACAVMYMSDVDSSAQKTPSPFRNDADVLWEIYKLLKGNLKDGKINISEALPNTAFAEYCSYLAGVDMVITVDEKNIVFDTDEDDKKDDNSDKKSSDDFNIWGVSIVQALADIGGTTFTINIDFSISEMTGKVNTTINGTALGVFTLNNLPWLKFENVGFTLFTYEDGSPSAGQLMGSLVGSDLYLLIDAAPTNGIRRIYGEFYSPLTAMDAFFALSGGINFTDSMPAMLGAVGGFGLKRVELYYDAGNSKITSMKFYLVTKNSWSLWSYNNSPIITLIPVVTVTVNSPQDLQGRTVSVTASGPCVFGNKEKSVGALTLYGSYPPFSVGMGLVKPFAIDDMLGIFGIKTELKTEITKLDIFAKPEDSYYYLSCAVKTEWKLNQNFTVSNLGLSLVHSQAGLYAAFAGTIELFPESSILIEPEVRLVYSQNSWDLSCRVYLGGKTVSMADLVKSYGGNSVALPSGTEDGASPLLAELTLNYSTGSGAWEISARTEKPWRIDFLSMCADACAKVGSGDDGKFFCNLAADVTWKNIDLAVSYSYLKEENNFFISLNFDGKIISAKVEEGDGNKIASFTLKNFSIGYLVKKMIGWATGTEFGLDAPWNILESWCFNCALNYNFNTQTVSVNISFDSEPKDLGFARLQGIELKYDGKKVLVTLNGKFLWNGANLGDSISWNAAEGGTAPVPAGKGNAYFDLRLLALGQKVRLFEKPPANVSEAIDALSGLDPEKLPGYDESTGWVVGANFGILKDKSSGAYFADLQLVFCDPSLFALRLSLAGPAAKVFAGFSFSILYTKISDTLGVYKADIALPDSIRHLSIGIFSITLPCFGIAVYTNGDFKVDFAFPANADFSRSFAIEGIIPPGIPVTGAAGFYFGKLSSATAENGGVTLPQSAKGLFNPAIIFGIGFRIGIGKSFSAGILSGGFSLTFFAMLEGIMAKWNPYSNSDLVLSSDGSIDDTWYYSIKGVIGVSGQVYGTVDFAVITASVSVDIIISAAFTYESYRASSVSIRAALKAHASLTINLGLFKIRLSFSFSFTFTETFQMGSNKSAPWDDNKLIFPAGIREIASLAMDFSRLLPDDSGPVDIVAHISLPLTAASGEWDDNIYVCGMALMTIITCDFKNLAEKIACWVVAAGLGADISEEDLRALTVTDEYLSQIEAYLSTDNENSVPVTTSDCDAFLQRFFKIKVADISSSDNGEKDSVFFPFPPGVHISTVCNESTEYDYTLGEYCKVSDKALRKMKDLFAKLALAVEQEQKGLSFGKNITEAGVSMAEWLFRDYFTLIAKHCVKLLRAQLKQPGEEMLFGKMLDALKDSDAFTNIGGIASRYNLHGLRIPAEDITPLKDGIWVKDGKFPAELGLFALCGAQFILPETYSGSDNWEVRFSSENTQWLSIPNGYCININTGNGMAAVVAALASYAKTSVQFPVTFEDDKADASNVMFSFGDSFTINHNTAWSIPDALPRDKGNFTLTLSAAAGELRSRPLDSWSIATIIEFRVKKSGTEGVFVIDGASEKHARLLAEIIKNKINILNYSLLDVQCDFVAASQIDLSTETHPPLNVATGKENKFIETLWKAFITNNGGYILTVCPSNALPETMFNDNGEGLLQLLIVLENNAEKNAVNITGANTIISPDKIADGERLYAGSNDPGGLLSYSSSSENTTSLVNVRYIIERTHPSAFVDITDEDYSKVLIENNFSLLRFGIEETDGFKKSGGSMPVSPQGGDSSKDPWHYSITVPADGCLNKGDYATIGKKLKTRFEWLDCYGNKLVPPFFRETVCGYKDSLVGISAWRGVAAKWETKKTADGPAISVTFSFDEQSCRYKPAAHRVFSRIFSQLTDVNGIVFKLKSPLFNQDVVFVQEKADALCDWVKEIRDFLLDSKKEAPDELSLEFPLSGNNNPSLFYEVWCAIVLERKGKPAEGYESIPDISTCTSVLNIPRDVKEFASAFECDIPGYKILKGADSVYAVKIKVDGTGDGLSLDMKLLNIFAPRPVSNTLQNRDKVNVYTYENGERIEKTLSYRGVDLNVWLKNALALIDKAFAPGIVSAVRIIEDCCSDKIAYGSLLEAKKNIAEKLKSLLVPVFKDEYSGGGLEEAQEVFRQRLLSYLSALYTVRNVISVSAEIQNASAIDDNTARLYGYLVPKDTPKACEITFSTAKIPLKNGENVFAFTISAPDIVHNEGGDILSSAKLNLSYCVTHIETDICDIHDGYVDSSWLAGATGNITSASISGFSAPFPLYTYPETPVMEEQGALLPGNKSELLKDNEFSWQYRYVYSQSMHYPQSQANITVRYNTAPESRETADSEDIFTVLARFDSAGPAILADLEKNAEAVLQNHDAAATKAFITAYTELITIVEELAGIPISLPAWQAPETAAEDTITFILKESKQDIASKKDCLCVSIMGRDDITPQIMPDVYTAERISGEGNCTNFLFKDRDGNYLLTADGQKIRERALVFPPRNILSCKNAKAEMYIEQNRRLICNSDIQTAPEFVFTTGVISFKDAYAVSAEISDTIDISSYCKDDRTLENSLKAFFAAVIAGCSSVTLLAECRYRTALNASLPPVEYPLFMQTPVVIEDGDTTRLIQDWSAVINKWLAQFPEDFQKSSDSFWFNIKFTDKANPVLSLKNCIYTGSIR